MASKEFLAKMKSHAEAWSEAKGAEQSGGFVEVPPGKYTVRLQKMTLDVTDDKAKVPFVQLDMVVVAGECEGQMIRKRTRIEERSGIIKNGDRKGEKWEQSIEDCLEEIARDLKGFSVETDELEIADLPSVADDLADEQPACRVEVKESKSGYLNVRIGKPVEDDDLPKIEDVMPEGDDDSDDDDDDDDDVAPAKSKGKGSSKKPVKDEDEDDDGDEDDDESDSDEDDEDEPGDDDDSDDEDEEDEVPDVMPPAKGETVTAKPKGTQKAEKHGVLTVNKTAQTCTLKRKRDGKTFKDVSWDLID